MAVFRMALGAGLALVVILASARVYLVALTAGAVLIPLLTLLYVYDVDI